jgi:hypothetical protein
VQLLALVLVVSLQPVLLWLHQVLHQVLLTLDCLALLLLPVLWLEEGVY